MKEILESIILNIVQDKSSVSIVEKEDEKCVTYEVKVAQDDMGRIIGKQGRIAKSIRIIMKSLAAKERKRVTIEFVG